MIFTDILMRKRSYGPAVVIDTSYAMWPEHKALRAKKYSERFSVGTVTASRVHHKLTVSLVPVVRASLGNLTAVGADRAAASAALIRKVMLGARAA